MKYRVWDNGAMYYPDQTGRYLLSMGGRIVDGDGNPYDETHIPLLYTGLKDKNSVEIYEGDILEEEIDLYKDCCYDDVTTEIVNQVVTYQDGYFTHDPDDKFSLVSNASFGKNPYVKVVGNIYENPELIKN